MLDRDARLQCNVIGARAPDIETPASLDQPLIRRSPIALQVGSQQRARLIRFAEHGAAALRAIRVRQMVCLAAELELELRAGWQLHIQLRKALSDSAGEARVRELGEQDRRVEASVARANVDQLAATRMSKPAQAGEVVAPVPADAQREGIDARKV